MNRMASFMLEHTFYERVGHLTGADCGAMHVVHSGRGGYVINEVARGASQSVHRRADVRPPAH